MEMSKDWRTDADRAELLAWADRCVARNEYERAHPDSDDSDDEPALAVSAPRTVSERAVLEERLRELQAQIAAVKMALAGGSGPGVTPSSPTVVDRPEPAAAHSGPGLVDTAANAILTGTLTEIASTTTTTAADGPSPSKSSATPSEVTASHERPPTVATSPPGRLEFPFLYD
ncbi:hypothetical protein EI94DRAFT_1748735 [Lactarius quietus]|nr:hypothetical protein EI94DRAFT_1748735 [Lactarius quietus]